MEPEQTREGHKIRSSFYRVSFIHLLTEDLNLSNVIITANGNWMRNVSVFILKL